MEKDKALQAVKAAPEDVRRDLDLVLKALHGVTFLLPAGPRSLLEKFLVAADSLSGQDWFIGLIAQVAGRLGDRKPTPEELKQAATSPGKDT